MRNLKTGKPGNVIKGLCRLLKKMKSVLIIIPFESIYPPVNGGMLRGINLLHQYAKYFEVTVILHQDSKSLLPAFEEFPALKNCTVLSTKEQKKEFDLFSFLPERIAKALRYRYWNRSLKGTADDNFLQTYPILRRIFGKKKFDYVVFEDLTVINIAKIIRRYQPKARIIYDAYNVNTRLAEAAVNNGYGDKTTYNLIKEAESSLNTLIDYVFTCSNSDLEQLRVMNKGVLHGTVIPNGVRVPPDLPEKSKETGNLFFCGSLDYSPNREGLLWFCKEVFPLILEQKPFVKLMVIGKGDPGEELLELLKNEAVIFYGKVDKLEGYYRKAAVAVVPLLTGSGTRLKVLEAMGMGVPVISTTIGAEGIEHTTGKNILLADDPAGFAKAVIKLVENGKLAEDLATSAYMLVKNKYDWNIIGNKMSEYLKKETEMPDA
jgi:glycosyltransferase involved in cell wall biosynthesis